MSALRIVGGGPLRGALSPPGDLEIGQEALLWASLAQGVSTVRGLLPGSGHADLVAVLRELGVRIDADGEVLRIHGQGGRFGAPRGALHVRESATALELTTALLAAQPFGTRIEVGAGLSRRSLRSLLEPLRARGALVAAQGGEDGDLIPPVSVAPLLAGERLAEVEIEIPEGDATTKRALLVSGLFARGLTAISEGMLSRDHSERALLALGLDVQTLGPLLVLDSAGGGAGFAPFDWTLPGDFGVAAWLGAAALCLPGSDLRLEGVGLNPTRAGFLTALGHLGAAVQVVPKGDCAGGEPRGELSVRGTGSLRGASFSGELALRMRSEACALLLLGAHASGRCRVRDLSALRRERPDRLSSSVELARAFGVEVTAYEDGFDVDPVSVLRPAEVAVPDPSLLGLAFSLALVAPGESRLDDGGRLDALYPKLIPALRQVGARIA